MEIIKDNLREIRINIKSACEKVGRNPKEIKLVAVIKNQSNESIKALYDLGIRNFGENRLQQLEAHQDFLNVEDVEWNFIGQIQKNKLAKIISRSQVIQSIDDVRFIETISKTDKPPKMYIQLAGSDDESRGGVSFTNAHALVSKAASLSVPFAGVMIVPPLNLDPIAFFDHAKKFAAENDLKEISMGMTNDYQLAIEHGATTIRIGSAIFKGTIPAL